MMRTICVFVLLPAAFAIPVRSQNTDTLLSILENADTQSLAEALTARFEAHGASLPEDLGWNFQKHTEVINFYRFRSRTVHLSRIPQRHQAESYWGNWSNVLTSERWQPDNFFESSDEAYLMAGYNQMLLAAHELGHAVANRYHVNPDPETTGLNCQEFFADRFASALASDLARESAAFDQLKQRYAALLIDINAHVADPGRYSIESLDLLLNACGEIQLVNPTGSEDVAPYASAYFARMGRLLEESDMGLSETAVQLLHTWQQEFFRGRPYLEVPVIVSTLQDDLPELPFDALPRNRGDVEFQQGLVPILGPESSTQTTVLDQNGELRSFVFHITMNQDSTWNYSVDYGDSSNSRPTVALFDEPQPSAVAFPVDALGHDANSFSALIGQAVANEERFYVLTAHFEGNDWHVVRGEPRGFSEALSLVGSSSGELAVIGERRFYSVNQASNQIAADSTPLALSSRPLAIDDERNFYSVHQSEIHDIGGVVFRGDDEYERTVAGNGLVGYVDGENPAAVEFQRIRSISALDSHTLIILEDLEWTNGGTRLRKIEINPQ